MSLDDEGAENLVDEGRLVCRWRRDQRHPAVGYTLTPYPDKAIVPDLHATWPVEPDPTFSVIRALNRFPALLWRNEKRTTCTLTVAVSDKQSFQVHEVTESGGEALCGVIDIAEAALINLTVGA